MKEKGKRCEKDPKDPKAPKAFKDLRTLKPLKPFKAFPKILSSFVFWKIYCNFVQNNEMEMRGYVFMLKAAHPLLTIKI